MITAHSGCEGTGIDTMESIEKALEFGADAIEIDVRMDRLVTCGSLIIRCLLKITFERIPLRMCFRESSRLLC